jgi:hypothetical protein
MQQRARLHITGAATLDSFNVCLSAPIPPNSQLLTHLIPDALRFVNFCAVVFGGGTAVQWATPDPSSFPPYKGVVPIILSWFFSPVLTGGCSAMVFSVVRSLVMRRENARNLVFWVLPPAVFITIFISELTHALFGLFRSRGPVLMCGVCCVFWGAAPGCVHHHLYQ